MRTTRTSLENCTNLTLKGAKPTPKTEAEEKVGLAYREIHSMPTIPSLKIQKKILSPFSLEAPESGSENSKNKDEQYGYLILAVLPAKKPHIAFDIDKELLCPLQRR